MPQRQIPFYTDKNLFIPLKSIFYILVPSICLWHKPYCSVGVWGAIFKDDIRKFEDTKGVIRSRKAKDRNIIAKRKRTKQWSAKNYEEN
jgi:hypothetical protein